MTFPRARRHAQATKSRALPRALSRPRDLTPRACGDHVRAIAARPGSSTAPHHHESGDCRHQTPTEDRVGTGGRQASRSGALVGPQRVFHVCPVLPDVARAKPGLSSRPRVPRARWCAVVRGQRFCVVCLRETLGRARSEERGGCVAPPSATNFGEKVELVVLDSLSPVAPALGVAAARATPSRARGGEI